MIFTVFWWRGCTAKPSAARYRDSSQNESTTMPPSSTPTVSATSHARRFAVALVASNIQVTATSRLIASRYAADDAREFLPSWNYTVDTVRSATDQKLTRSLKASRSACRSRNPRLMVAGFACTPAMPPSRSPSTRSTRYLLARWRWRASAVLCASPSSSRPTATKHFGQIAAGGPRPIRPDGRGAVPARFRSGRSREQRGRVAILSNRGDGNRGARGHVHAGEVHQRCRRRRDNPASDPERRPVFRGRIRHRGQFLPLPPAPTFDSTTSRSRPATSPALTSTRSSSSSTWCWNSARKNTLQRPKLPTTSASSGAAGAAWLHCRPRLFPITFRHRSPAPRPSKAERRHP